MQFENGHSAPGNNVFNYHQPIIINSGRKRVYELFVCYPSYTLYFIMCMYKMKKKINIPGKVLCLFLLKALL